jgi:hypothetical protein
MTSSEEELTDEILTLGGFVDEPESETKEYKEFCLKIDLPQEIAEKIIKEEIKSASSFNGIIIKNLQEYLNIYIPKYASAWSSTNIEIGVMKIGISDDQEVTGIPYIGELSEIDMNELFMNSFRYLRGINNNEISETVLRYYTENINFRIRKLEIIPELLEDPVDDFLENYRKKVNEMNEKKRNIMMKRKAWWGLIAFYTRKLCYLSDSIRYRKEMGNYIRETDNSKCDLIELCFNFELDIIVPYDETFWERKKDEDDIIHWITKYKDHAIRELLKQKPKIPHIINYNLPYSYLIKQLTKLRKRFISQNINYFVIEIEFIGNKNENEYLEYSYDNVYWISKRRIGSSCENW